MKNKLFLLTMLMVLGATGCDKQKDTNVDSKLDSLESTASLEVSSEKMDETNKESDVESADGISEEDDSEETITESKSIESNDDAVSSATITSDQALAAVRNYCIKRQPELADMENSEDYTLYWEVESSDTEQTVVLYRSYTGAQVRYYVDNKTGDVYITEFVPGITEEEERTEETFNVKEYMDDSASQGNNGLSGTSKEIAGASGLEGTWQSASMVEEDGVAQSEIYVQFTDKVIHYGHLKDVEFVVDYSDEIVSFEELDNGGYRVLAKNSNGVQYTYQTCETDANIMEYYGTWDEAEFADAYSGSASIFRQ